MKTFARKIILLIPLKENINSKMHFLVGFVLQICKQTCSSRHLPPFLQVMQTFIESERLYLNNLTVLDSRYQQPMRTLSAFKPDVLPLKQLESLFLNW